jgi:hypothetical protein
MRKLILTSAFVLASVAAAHAGPSRSLVLAAADTPAPVAAETAAPAPPASQPQTTQARPAITPVEAQAPAQPDQPQAAPAEAPKRQAAKPAKKTHARSWESDEHKARRIAAHYGVYW